MTIHRSIRRVLDLSTSVTPCNLALAAAAILFLWLPSGIPHLYAECETVFGDDPVLSILDSDDCTTPGGPMITAADVTLSATTPDHCVIKLSATVTIEDPVKTTTCELYISFACGGGGCAGSPELAATGNGEYEVSKTLACGADNDLMDIDFHRGGSVCTGCSPIVVVHGTAICGYGS